jgi:molybdopterin-guanine dinucleotide biosynthesis protein B
MNLRKVAMNNLIAVIGAGRESGKTTTMEELIRELTRRGYKVGAIKQIHEEDFSIDTPEKDTWRIADAGAGIVVAAAPKEVAAIKRLQSEDRFTEALKFMQGEELDIVLVEGNPPMDVPKIFVARSPEAAKRIMPKVGGKILCISSFSPETFDKREFKIVYHPKKDVKKMANLIENSLKGKFI